MKKWVNISDTVEITNNRVKPFKGERRYLATGDLIGDAVNEGINSGIAFDFDPIKHLEKLTTEQKNYE